MAPILRSAALLLRLLLLSKALLLEHLRFVALKVCDPLRESWKLKAADLVQTVARDLVEQREIWALSVIAFSFLDCP